MPGISEMRTPLGPGLRQRSADLEEVGLEGVRDGWKAAGARAPARGGDRKTSKKTNVFRNFTRALRPLREMRLPAAWWKREKRGWEPYPPETGQGPSRALRTENGRKVPRKVRNVRNGDGGNALADGGRME